MIADHDRHVGLAPRQLPPAGAPLHASGAAFLAASTAAAAVVLARPVYVPDAAVTLERFRACDGHDRRRLDRPASTSRAFRRWTAPSSRPWPTSTASRAARLAAAVGARRLRRLGRDARPRGLDAVVVCTPPLLTAIRAWPRSSAASGVYLEKPVARTTRTPARSPRPCAPAPSSRSATSTARSTSCPTSGRGRRGDRARPARLLQRRRDRRPAVVREPGRGRGTGARASEPPHRPPVRDRRRGGVGAGGRRAGRPGRSRPAGRLRHRRRAIALARVPLRRDRQRARARGRARSCRRPTRSTSSRPARACTSSSTRASPCAAPAGAPR